MGLVTGVAKGAPLNSSVFHAARPPAMNHHPSTRVPSADRPVRPALLAAAALLAALAQSPAQAQAAAAGDKPIAQLLSEQKWPEALAAIDGLLKTRPSDTQLLMNRGAVLSNMNRNAEALSTFQKVVTLNPQLPAAHNNIAVILAATGRYDEARASLERALKVAPNYATAYENLGDLYIHQANESYRKAVQIDRGLSSAKTKLDKSTELIILATGAPPVERAPAAASGAAPAAPMAAPATVASPPPPATAPASSKAGTSAGTSAAAPAPAPAPAPTAAPAVVAGDPAVAAQVEAAVQAWAQAWARRDTAAYTAAYAPEFRGSAPDAQTWRAEARARLEARSRIVVRLSELEISVEGDRAKARFQQFYDSDQPDSRRRTRKTLELQRVQGQWLIREEVRR